MLKSIRALQALTSALAHPQAAGAAGRPGGIPRAPSGANLFSGTMHRTPSSNIFAQHLQNQVRLGGQ